MPPNDGAQLTVTSEDFRNVCARWATGVTIVTARNGETIHGMTVSAFTEVCLDPPLVLVCADLSSHTHPVIEGGGVFAVNILARDQEELSNRFASKKDEWRRFDGLRLETGKTGAPLIPDTVAALDCRVVAAHVHGDHVVYIGEVQEARYSDREPLLHCQRAYGSFSKESA
jgi:flavin reductase (DIM6/NTAB) family NADH-FMN oxidoreductase RutF